MPPLTLSDKYGIATVVALALLILVNNAVIMLVVSAIGLAAGFYVARQDDAKRVAWIATAAYAISLAFAGLSLLG